MATPPKPEKSQSRRFIEAARALGADESEEAFDRALKKIASAPPAPNVPTKGKRTAMSGKTPKHR